MPELTLPAVGLLGVFLWIVLTFYFKYANHQFAKERMRLESEERDRREKASKEDKHEPSIDSKIQTQVGSVATMLQEQIANARKEASAGDEKIHGRISGFRKEIEGMLNAQDARSEERMNGLTATLTAFTGQMERSVGRIESSVDDLKKTDERILQDNAETRARIDHLQRDMPKK